MRTFIITILTIAAMASVCFADVGPGPAQPDIIVHFTQNGVPYTGQARAIFHCGEAPLNGTSPLSPRDFELTCDSGVCRNQGWFYKFNPCFYPKSGSIKYVLGGGDAFRTTDENLAFPEGKTYEITVDSDSGVYRTNETAKLCPLSILGFGMLGLGILRIRLSRG